MSNKRRGAISETQEQQGALVPRLRFPEFRDAGWKVKQLSEIATIHKGKGIAKTDIVDNGRIVCIRYGELYTLYSEVIDVVYSKTNLDRENLFFSKKNDVIIPSSGETKIDIATASCVMLGDVALGGDLNVVRSRENGKFISYFINGPLKYVIAKIAQGDTVVHLYPTQLEKIKFAIPSEKIEQQKIADCLSTLNEIISLISRKLETLKTHKKGLMQQLFPCEGEASPRLRFPEFQVSGEWSTNLLGEAAQNLDNLRVPIAEVSRVKGKTPYYGASGVVDYVDGYIFDEELLCVSEDGANLTARTLPIAFSISGKSWVNNHAHVFRFSNKNTKKLVEDYINSIPVNDYVTGMAQPKLNKAMLEVIPIPLPQDPLEQEKIADILFYIDTNISVHAEKLESLKTHKKGLMQQLFPNIPQAVG